MSLLMSSVVAADPWLFEGSVFFDRNASNLADGRRSLEARIGTSFAARRPYELETGQKGEWDFGVSYERYPSNRRADRYFVDAGINHKIPLSVGLLRQLSFSSEATHARDDRNWVFSRMRIGAKLNWAFAPRNMLQTGVRIGYRDQNDAYTFDGYDQSEFLIKVAHNARSADGVRRTYTSLYYERRDADHRRFSYDQIGVRFTGRHDIADWAELIGRTAGFFRNYDDGGRKDRRFTGTVGVGWKATDKTTLEAYVGYERNSSTFDEKDYGGGLIGIKLGRAF